jgi:uncharacterized membrane protein YgcG
MIRSHWVVIIHGQTRTKLGSRASATQSPAIYSPTQVLLGILIGTPLETAGSVGQRSAVNAMPAPSGSGTARRDASPSRSVGGSSAGGSTTQDSPARYLAGQPQSFRGGGVSSGGGGGGRAGWVPQRPSATGGGAPARGVACFTCKCCVPWLRARLHPADTPAADPARWGPSAKV